MPDSSNTRTQLRTACSGTMNMSATSATVRPDMMPRTACILNLASGSFSRFAAFVSMRTCPSSITHAGSRGPISLFGKGWLWVARGACLGNLQRMAWGMLGVYGGICRAIYRDARPSLACSGPCRTPCALWACHGPCRRAACNAACLPWTLQPAVPLACVAACQTAPVAACPSQAARRPLGCPVRFWHCSPMRRLGAAKLRHAPAHTMA